MYIEGALMSKSRNIALRKVAFFYSTCTAIQILKSHEAINFYDNMVFWLYLIMFIVSSRCHVSSWPSTSLVIRIVCRKHSWYTVIWHETAMTTICWTWIKCGKQESYINWVSHIGRVQNWVFCFLIIKIYHFYKHWEVYFNLKVWKVWMQKALNLSFQLICRLNFSIFFFFFALSFYFIL